MRKSPAKADLFLVLAVMLFLAVTGACGILTEKELYGAPTPIPDGQSALAVVRMIQNEFIQLNKPVLKKLKYHKQWKKTRFADSTYTYGPFYEVVLSREAYDFYRKHTAREIFTALTPLLFDPRLGGEVAVLLSGIPCKNLETAAGRHVGDVLAEMGYASPEEQGVWDIRSNRSSSYIGYPGVFFDAYENPPEGTLDHAIYSVLKEEYGVRNHPRRDYFEPFAAGFEGKKFKNLHEFEMTQFRPGPSRKFEEFIATHADLFSTTVLLASVRQNAISLIWSLNLQEEFWPLSIYKAAFDHTPFQMSTFRKQMSEMEELFIQKAGKKIYQAYAESSP